MALGFEYARAVNATMNCCFVKDSLRSKFSYLFHKEVYSPYKRKQELLGSFFGSYSKALSTSQAKICLLTSMVFLSNILHLLCCFGEALKEEGQSQQSD